MKSTILIGAVPLVTLVAGDSVTVQNVGAAHDRRLLHPLTLSEFGLHYRRVSYLPPKIVICLLIQTVEAMLWI